LKTALPAPTPQQIHALFLNAFNRGDVETLVALYEPGAVLAVGNGNAIGHPAIRRAYQRLLADGARMQLETAAVLESGDGLAVLHARWTYRRGQEAVSGMSTEVVRRQPDGSWRFVIDEPKTPNTGEP
jgi:ketosteroid isomerase-like protein